jgi:hypothetical protein
MFSAVTGGGGLILAPVGLFTPQPLFRAHAQLKLIASEPVARLDSLLFSLAYACRTNSCRATGRSPGGSPLRVSWIVNV